VVTGGKWLTLARCETIRVGFHYDATRTNAEPKTPGTNPMSVGAVIAGWS